MIVVADAAIAGAWASIQFNSIISIHFSDAQFGLDQINVVGAARTPGSKRGQAPLCEAPFGPLRQRSQTPF
jgi:hypothetical protein